MKSSDDHASPMERRRRVVALRESGKTYREIGDIEGCGKQRAMQLYQRGIADAEEGASPYADLSVRARNALNNVNIGAHYKTADPRSEVRRLIQSGDLHPLGKLRNYGMKTHREICKWAGVGITGKSLSPMCCPHCGKSIAKDAEP